MDLVGLQDLKLRILVSADVTGLFKADRVDYCALVEGRAGTQRVFSKQMAECGGRPCGFPAAAGVGNWFWWFFVGQSRPDSAMEPGISFGGVVRLQL